MPDLMAIICWGLSGSLGTLGALCFAELGTTIPRSGEKYAYMQEMFGPFAAFMYLWMYLMMYRAGGNAIQALTFGKYVLQPFYPDWESEFFTLDDNNQHLHSPDHQQE